MAASTEDKGNGFLAYKEMNYPVFKLLKMEPSRIPFK
jgi:hypothetical protein